MNRKFEVLLDVKEVSARVKLAVRTVWRLRNTGGICAPVTIGRAVRWRESDIERWMADGCRPVRSTRGGR